MPSSYTNDLYEGKDVTFEQFVLKCARAFGANIHMRDEPLNSEIKEYVASEYSLKKAEEARKRLEELEAMTEAEIKAYNLSVYNDSVIRHNEAAARNAEMKDRYTKMLERVERWVPPTNDHKDLKEFMIRQIKDSIDFDIYTPEYPPSNFNYHEKVIEREKWNIEYHTRSYREEVQRANKFNEWNRQLKESLR